MTINGATELYGIMGNPVTHSLSPAMHNAAFKELGLNKVYVPFPVMEVCQALDGFRALGVKGVSVTIPHKQTIIPCLDEVRPVARKIGAVNTLLIDDQGRTTGVNTDWQGANKALQQVTDLQDKEVVILGAGGSARAIGFGLLEAGARPIICSRTPASGQELAESLGAPWYPLSEGGRLKADILINATSVGMSPKQECCPLDCKGLDRFPVVMDIVYSPLETRLLREARQAGCQVIDGLAMLLFQGVIQFELWTGLSAPVEVMRQTLHEMLSINKPK